MSLSFIFLTSLKKNYVTTNEELLLQLHAYSALNNIYSHSPTFSPINYCQGRLKRSNDHNIPSTKSLFLNSSFMWPTRRKALWTATRKLHPRTGHEDPEVEKRYSSTLSLTSALDGVGGQRHAPAALHPGTTRCSLYRRLGGPQDRSGRVRKISPTPGFDPQTVQHVASRYADWAIPAHWTVTRINF
jgi:hypothetical protein